MVVVCSFCLYVCLSDLHLCRYCFALHDIMQGVLSTTAQPCTARHSPALHGTAQHCTALRCTALHCTRVVLACGFIFDRRARCSAQIRVVLRRRVWVRPARACRFTAVGFGSAPARACWNYRRVRVRPRPRVSVAVRRDWVVFFPPGLARYGSVVIPSHTVFESFLCCDPFTHCFRVISVHRVSRQSCADRRCLFPSVERTAICLPSPGDGTLSGSHCVREIFHLSSGCVFCLLWWRLHGLFLGCLILRSR